MKKIRRFTLTTRDMLNAAQRRLDEHRKLRPAMTAEAAQIARGYRAQAEDLRDRAAPLKNRPMRTAAEIGHGPHAVAAQHGDAIMAAEDRAEAALMEHHARLADGQAEAWERIAGEPEGKTYFEVLNELEARVDFYQRLLSSETAAA